MCSSKQGQNQQTETLDYRLMWNIGEIIKLDNELDGFPATYLLDAVSKYCTVLTRLLDTKPPN